MFHTQFFPYYFLERWMWNTKGRFKIPFERNYSASNNELAFRF